MNLKEEIINLYRRTATEMPEDVVIALKKAKEQDTAGKEILATILKNIRIAKLTSKPICQDTGMPFFYVSYPKDYSEEELRRTINEATITATRDIPLRPNAVDSLSGKNIGNIPTIHFKQSNKLKIELLLKGGGSENVSAIYQLPNNEINAHRNLDGVKKCVIDSVFKAQGKGCPPYIIGVAIGGSMEDVAYLSKKQLLRKIEDKNLVHDLRDFEENVLNDVNKLNIGPLGLGGKTTVLAVKIAETYRHPASFFAGVSLSCWCLRRQSL